MGTAERRLEILKYLCRARKTTMPHLAKEFGVSIRTIQRDILEIEATFHIPLRVTTGRHGGIYVLNNYSFDRTYMCEEELELLRKIKDLVKSQIDNKENELLLRIIKNYSKSA